ncbi:hypothetical protein SVIOM342S_10443 [Streptomyces violaceorubidus]
MEQTQTSHNGTATQGAQRRVLVVEDDQTIVDAIATRLRAEGFWRKRRATDRPPSTRPRHGSPTC